MRDIKPVLLVEDDKVDAMTTERAFRDLKVVNTLTHRINGEDALAYLRDPETDCPCVILLDINMPKMNGLEFLEEVKRDEALKHIPVVMLTTSKKEFDINESFLLSAAGYIVKPVDYQKFVDAIRILDLYWTLSETPGIEKGIPYGETETASFSGR